ncbi:GGDEF domain-containing protein [Massilia sp. SR12]
MNSLHVGTCALALGLASLAVGIAFFGLRAERGGRTAGSNWSMAACCQGLAWILIGLRGQLPDFASVMVGNLLIAANSIFLLRGAQRYAGRNQVMGLAGSLGILLLSGLGYAWYSYIDIDLHGRIIVTSVVRVPMLLAAMWWLWRHAPRHGRDSLVLLFAIDAAWHVVRGLASAGNEVPIHDFLNSDGIQAATFLLRAACIILIIATQFRIESDGARTALQTWARELEEESASLEKTIEERNRELLALATTDFLSGIANRRQFLRQAESEIARARRYGHPLSVLMIDIDHFKSINDRFGHLSGDRAIAAMGKLCACIGRSSDFAGRLGGEEFAVLLPESGPGEAQVCAERLRQGARALALSHEGQPVAVTVSIGIASLQPEDLEPAALLVRADQALYQAKAAGRDCVRGDAHASMP